LVRGAGCEPANPIRFSFKGGAMPPLVLSVEADAVVRGLRAALLRDAGFDVVEAATGADALKLAAEKQPALAVVAVELPGMDGLAVCRRLKADPHTASIPVLHVSSRGESLRDYPDSIESGAGAWLREPLDPAVFVSVAKALVRAGSSDIAGLMRVEKALRERIEELETVMEVAPAAIWAAHDPQCREITGNRMADRFYEADAGENVSANVTDARRFFQGGRELHAQELPMQEAAARGIDIRDSELDVLLPSGKRLSMLGSASPLRDALRESEAVLRSFFDSPGVMRGIVELIDGRIVHVSCNAAAAEMYGVSRESIAGKSASEAGAPNKVARRWVALYEKARRTGKAVSMEYARRDANGQERRLLGGRAFRAAIRVYHPRSDRTPAGGGRAAPVGRAVPRAVRRNDRGVLHHRGDIR
jgi:PAS domain S-box-containing protein